ncbi:LppM family (lipo)protein [Actinomyces israelii]|uniref:LppM family (lipo)protein n=1 Tax=Actinomyces israelii TaxID=1659 RepID=UPI0012EB5666|nr:hypothetical protein [Actinomyces israelii]
MRAMASAALRRLGLTLIIPALLALSACGINYDVTIHSNDTVDLTAVFWGLDKEIMESACSAKGTANSAPPSSKLKPTYTLTEYKGHPACQVDAEAVPLSEFSSPHENPSITHSDGKFEITVPSTDFNNRYEGLDSRYTVTFPGRVIEASGNAKTSGSTVTWDNYLNANEDLHAVGRDSPDPPWAWIGVGAIAVMIVGGGAALTVIMVTRRKHSANGAPPGPYNQPGTPYQLYQPGIPQPAYEQSGHAQPGYGQPSYRQSGYSQPDHAQPGSEYAQQGPTQPGCGQADYGRPGYVQPGHSQPGYGQPWYSQPDYSRPSQESPGPTQSWPPSDDHSDQQSYNPYQRY